MPTTPAGPLLAPPAPPGDGLGRRPVWILIAVFVLGIIAGGGGGVWLAPHVHHRLTRHERYVRRMTKLLNLTPAQTGQFRVIVNDAASRWQGIHQQLAPQYRALFEQELSRFAPIRAQERARLRALLTPQQRSKFDAWVTQWDLRHAARAHPAEAATAHHQP